MNIKGDDNIAPKVNNVNIQSYKPRDELLIQFCDAFMIASKDYGCKVYLYSK